MTAPMTRLMAPPRRLGRSIWAVFHWHGVQ